MSDAENVSGVDSREKTKLWLEDILQTYYAKKSKSPPLRPDQVPITILDFDIGPGFTVGAGEGPVSTLSDLLSLHVRYKVRTQSMQIPNTPFQMMWILKTSGGWVMDD